MRNLISFILRYHFFLLFFLLELLSLLLIIGNNGYQQSVVFRATTDFTGRIHEALSEANHFINLNKENTRLAEENAMLRKNLESSFLATDLKVQYVNDTVYRHRYSYIAALVVSNSTSRRDNYIIINKGSRHGLAFDMGVMTSAGIVGIVKDVSNNFSTVLSVLNSEVKVSAKLKKNGYVGTLLWNGRNYRLGTLIDVPLHAMPEVGDTVITSGFSLIFPEGVPIGTIASYDISSGQDFYKIDVKYMVDFNRLHNVYVVKDFYKAELDSLQKEEVK
jgi:rod shape-determining protein MreC